MDLMQQMFTSLCQRLKGGGLSVKVCGIPKAGHLPRWEDFLLSAVVKVSAIHKWGGVV
jgi:hypothetical protein